MQLKRSAIAAWLFVMAPVMCYAVEKYWIARNSALVVVGTLTDVSTGRSGTMWYLDGKVVVSEVLSGHAMQRDGLKFHFVCSCCPGAPIPGLRPFSHKGLWFLIPRFGGAWTSAGQCSDLGFRPMDDLADFRRFFVRQNQPTAVRKP